MIPYHHDPDHKHTPSLPLSTGTMSDEKDHKKKVNLAYVPRVSMPSGPSGARVLFEGEVDS